MEVLFLKLSIGEASKILGVAESTLRRWEYEGRLIPERTVSGHRRYDRDALLNFKYHKENVKLTIGYCRVSSSDQREDLVRQVKTVSDYCEAKGYQFKIIQDLGSGLNYNKKALKELIELIVHKEIERVVINYRDRLIRFGYEIIEQLCLLNDVEIEVINYSEDKNYEEELVEDILSVITVFSARLYGNRSHKTRNIVESNKKLFKEDAMDKKAQ
ncbi:MAG: IS607 family transposase [Clostridiales bacterium]|nr:IS607 family transposase [Clostridiales bacterium]